MKDPIVESLRSDIARTDVEVKLSGDWFVFLGPEVPRDLVVKLSPDLPAFPVYPGMVVRWPFRRLLLTHTAASNTTAKSFTLLCGEAGTEPAVVMGPPGSATPVHVLAPSGAPMVTNASADARGGDLALNTFGFNYVFNGTTWDRARTPAIFKRLRITGTGPTAIHTPGVGKRFRLLRAMLAFEAGATVAAAGQVTAELYDNGAAAWSNGDAPYLSVYLTAAAQAFGMIGTGWMDFGNGLLQSAAATPVQLRLSSGLGGGGGCWAYIAGTEE